MAHGPASTATRGTLAGVTGPARRRARRGDEAQRLVHRRLLRIVHLLVVGRYRRAGTWFERCDWQSLWQSNRRDRAGRDATRRTAGSTRPAAMLPGSTSRTGRGLLLIRKVQVRVLPGAQMLRSAACAFYLACSVAISWLRRVV